MQGGLKWLDAMAPPTENYSCQMFGFLARSASQLKRYERWGLFGIVSADATQF
jgi:hypothetical protein